MGTILPAIFLVLVVLVILGGTLMVRWARRRTLVSEPSRRSTQLVGFRKAAGWRWAGLGVGIVVAVPMAGVGPLGLGLELAPAVFGLCVIAGVVAGELATTPRHEGVRTATLEIRTVGDYLPRRLSRLVAACTLGLGTLLVATTLMGSNDDMGRVGRSLERRCSADWGAGTGPWPGLFYSVPLAIAVAVGLLGAGIALRTVVLRPRRGSTPELVAADDLLRRRSAEAVVAATGVMVATSLCGVALFAGRGLLGIDCGPLWWTVLGVALLAVAALMFLLVGGCLAQLLIGPGIRPGESRDGVRASEEVHL
jgi:hypothetical protein